MVTDTTPFADLDPDRMLDAVESCGLVRDSRFAALNNYENRVYQVGVDDGEPIIAKFYRPRRWQAPAFPITFPWFNTPRYWEERVLELREQIAAMQEPPLGHD